ncbi:DNA invertase Pin-like site-specific DNA recombinase [Sphingopyxis panaciterrae]|uniref:recombinase family protein n=1 Tax=Sphingopyxis panaciterrae TaxID=363841 RepID=UPI001FBAD451|nr:recombinase family protein [Sphingopyxis panaciterrae]NIJ38532.1 DNA invertase Pin-like site-specific DNA recombinase [Sphingopyxis panaciterrae]
MAKELVFQGAGAGPTRAAQYIRMSTEHQRYSPDNQRIAIAAFAAYRGFEIVRTYEDSGKSGLTLSGRPALKQMLSDVLSGTADFDTILVLDVSRWGRFQNTDHPRAGRRQTSFERARADI